ncbi:MAG: extracellular solute-binding protein [Bacilli bacterium]|nr:extracellular solute-binding protein [Bacilli bacterium]
MKKLWMPIFSALLLSLASCGGGGGSDKITLKIGFWPEPSDTADVAMYQTWAKRFMEENPQYEIKGVPYTYSTETVGQKYSTGMLPDVWQTWFTEPGKLMDKNIIRPITAQVKATGWDAVMDEAMKEELTFNNELYGIPRDGYGLGLLLNKRILGDNGFLPEIDGKYSIFNEDGSPAYPTSFEEIMEISETLVDQDNVRGFLMYSANKNGGWVFSNMAWNFGAELEKKEGDRIVANLNDPAAVRALEWVKEMRVNGFLQEAVSCVYNDWYANIGERVAFAIVGSDVLQNAKLLGDVNMDDLAFVPMPTGDNTHHYSLYGGTPFVFTKGVSDAKVEGILKFFSYIGRSPELTDNNLLAKQEGYEVAKRKAQPILPTIMPWKQGEFLTKAKELESRYVNVNLTDYNPFFNAIDGNKHSEVPYNAQEMYEALDTAIQSVFTSMETANCQALLTTANTVLQNKLDEGVNRK